MASDKNIAHAHDTHREFNRRFEPDKPAKPLDISGPWLSNEVVTRLPRVRQAFDLNRDPHHLQDNEKSESKRGKEQSGGRGDGGSGMVKREKPQLSPKPPAPISQSVDRRDFQDRWLSEQRDWVMRHAAKPKPTPELQREISRTTKEPSR